MVRYLLGYRVGGNSKSGINVIDGMIVILLINSQRMFGVKLGLVEFVYPETVGYAYGTN